MSLQEAVAQLLVDEQSWLDLERNPAALGKRFNIGAGDVAALVDIARGIRVTAITSRGKRIANLERRLPTTMKALEACGRKRDVLREFCTVSPPTRDGPTATKVRRDVERFVQYLEGDAVAGILPSFMGELARYELLHVLLHGCTTPAASDGTAGGLPQLLPSVALFEHSVDVLAIERQLLLDSPVTGAEVSPGWLLLQSTDGRVGVYRLGRLTYRVLSLCDGRTAESQMLSQLAAIGETVSVDEIRAVLDAAVKNQVILPLK